MIRIREGHVNHWYSMHSLWMISKTDLLQHLKYLKEIVVVHGHTIPLLFDEIDKIIDTLGLENMSSDEMDMEDLSPYSKKWVHHIGLPWLDNKGVGLKQSLEKLDHSRRHDKEKLGNPSCICIPSATKTET
jgi:hypothetical protein